jgi:hypothetical protein
MFFETSLALVFIMFAVAVKLVFHQKHQCQIDGDVSTKRSAKCGAATCAEDRQGEPLWEPNDFR